MAKKKEFEKQLDAQAREHGATLSKSEGGFVLSKENERAVLHVTEDTPQHEIDRYLRGAGA